MGIHLCSGKEVEECTLRVWTPKFSRQGIKERNCGQHCVSMITHLPVDLICKEFKKYKGTHIKDVSGMLRWFGVDCDVTLTKYRKGDILPDLCVAHVRGHWHIIHRGRAYDSCVGVFEAENDTRRLISYFKVQEPKL